MGTSRGTAARQPLAQHAYEIIKRQILTFDLAPGRMVYAHSLASDLGISQTPIHEALKRLCAERLVSVIPHTGYVVSPITVTDAQEMFQLRLTLEPAVARIATQRCTDAQLKAFRDRFASPGVHSSPGASRDWARMDPRAYADLLSEEHDAFHLAVAELSGQARMHDILRELLHTGRRLSLLSQNARRGAPPNPTRESEHARIARAVLARDGSSAADAVAEHVRNSYRDVLTSLASLGLDDRGADGQPRVLG